MSEKKPERRGLGRGLSALMADIGLGEAAAARGAPGEAEGGAGGGMEGGASARPDLLVGIDLLEPNPDQPRRDFSFDALTELSESIRRRGVIQPLIVRRHPEKADHYQIVAGERRWRAAQMARLHDVPVLIRDFSDTEVIEVALIENIQRAELNAIEEAAAYRQLMERFGHTQEKLAEALSKSRSHIANLLRLLTLPPEVQDWLRAGRLTAGHARALVSTPDPTRLARTVIERGLSVREAEALAREAMEPGRTTARAGHKPRANAAKDADTLAIEADLSAHLRMPVRIEHQGIDGGRVSITYKSLDQLDRICQILSGTA